MAIFNITNKLQGYSYIIDNFFVRVFNDSGIVIDEEPVRTEFNELEDTPYDELPSLLLLPSASKDGKLYSILPESGNGDFTVTRGSFGTVINEKGNIEIVGGSNEFLWSSDLQNVYWGSSGTTVSSGFEDPFGGNNAFRLISTGTNLRLDRDVISPFIGEVWTISAWVKSNDGGNSKFRFVGDGTVFSPDITPTTEWKRYSHTISVPSPGGGYGIRNASTSGNTDILVYGMQLEESPIAREYIETSGSVRSLLNKPRIDYSTGKAGILIEGQSTNLEPYSYDYVNGGYTRLRIDTIESTDTITDYNSYELLCNQTSSSSYLRKSITLTGAGDWVLSCLIKKGQGTDFARIGLNSLDTGNEELIFDLENGVIANNYSTNGGGIKYISNGWYLCWITVNTSIDLNGTILVKSVSSGISTESQIGQSVFCNHLQVESGTTPSSIIPTNGSTVTRLADNISIKDEAKVQSILQGQDEFSFIAHVYYNPIQSIGQTLLNIETSSNNRILLINSASNDRIRLSVVRGGDGLTIEPTTDYFGDIKLGFKISSNGENKLFINGEVVGTSTNANTSFTESLSNIVLGGRFNTPDAQFNGVIYSAKFSPTALTDQELIDLTT